MIIILVLTVYEVQQCVRNFIQKCFVKLNCSVDPSTPALFPFNPWFTYIKIRKAS